MAVVDNTNSSDLEISAEVGSSSQISGEDDVTPSKDDDVASSKGDNVSSNAEVEQLQELLSKLNPMAEEFVPPFLAANGYVNTDYYNNGFYTNGSTTQNQNDGIGGNNSVNRRRRNGYGQGKKRMSSRTNMAQREDAIKKTVYVSDIDQQVTEEELATLFINCGQVVDCRVCGDPNSVLRFAFVEFTDEESAKEALKLSGTMLGFYPVKVLPSKTAIAPVDPKFLPQSINEREQCTRTIYCTNIDKKITQADIRLFFESICGPIFRLRLLGDYHHSTRIAFVEFFRYQHAPSSAGPAGIFDCLLQYTDLGNMAESAIAALNCSGAVLGSLPLRISPSKTPVRVDAPRPRVHVA